VPEKPIPCGNDDKKIKGELVCDKARVKLDSRGPDVGATGFI
jgi:hypothetical protein